MESERKKIERQDLVDNAIYTLMQELNPSNVDIDWDIDLIGKIRDTVIGVFVDDLVLCEENDFYPYLD